MWVVKCRWDEWVNPFYCLLPSAYHFFLVSVGEQAYHIQAHDEQQWYPSTPDVFLISCCSKLLPFAVTFSRLFCFDWTSLLLSLLGVSVERGSREDIITWRINPDDERDHHGNCQSCGGRELVPAGGCDCHSKSEPQSSVWHADSL